MKEPIWLTMPIVEAMHTGQIREHGGAYGIRDKKLLESSIERPINRFLFEELDIIRLASVYGYGLAKNQCFIDGNKRIAFLAMYTFLGLNGYEIDAKEPEVVESMIGVAESSISEEQLIRWLHIHVRPDTDSDK